MARRALAAGSLGVLLALCVWWLWGRGEPDVSPEAVVTPATGSVPLARSAEPVGVVSGASPSRERVVAPRVVRGSPSAAAVQVRVLGPDHQPLAGVVVCYGNPAGMSEARGGLAAAEQREIDGDDELLVRRLGKAATTDAEGIARWPFVEMDRAWWQCVARTGEIYGETWVSMAAPPSKVHELQLAVDRSFVVQVVDGQQKPAANVAVQATYLLLEAAARQSTNALGRTDAEGRLPARHIQTWTSGIAPRGSLLPVTVETDLPGLPVAREIDAKEPPAEPIVLALPPAGEIEITVRDAIGKPVSGAYFELREDVAAPDRVHASRSDTNGIARYAFVGLGRRWRLDRDHEAPDRAKIVEGPHVAGEIVRVLLQPDPLPVLTGQLVRDGKVAAAADFVATGGVAAMGCTDAEGRFRIAVKAPRPDQLLTEWVIHTTTKEGFDGMSATWSGQVLLGLGEHDLGVLALHEDPIVCAGQVLGPGGEAVPAEVLMVVEATTPDAEDAPRAVMLRQRREPDGHFTMYGPTPEGALQIAVRTDNRYLRMAPIPFAAGARGLRVQLHCGGSLRATILAESMIAAFCLQPRLLPEAALELPDYARFSAQLDPRMPLVSNIVNDEPLEIAYRWPAVAPGRYRLEIGTRGVRKPIQVLQDVIIRDGERNEDARLQRIVLTGLRTVEITLPQAAQVPSAAGAKGLGIIYVLDGDELGEQCWRIDNGLAQFASTGPLDVLVRLRGFRDRIVRGIVSNTTIELEPGLPVALRCEALSVPEGSVVTVSLDCLDDRLTAAHSAVYSAAAGGAVPVYRLESIVGELVEGEVVLKVPTPGRYRVSASLRKLDGGVIALVAEPAELQIGAAGGTFPVRLRGN